MLFQQKGVNVPLNNTKDPFLSKLKNLEDNCNNPGEIRALVYCATFS